MNYHDYVVGRLDAYTDALYIVRTTMEEYKREDKLEFIQKIFERQITWNKEELERQEKEQ